MSTPAEAEQGSRSRRSILQAGSIVVAGIALGRLAGFARELLIAHHLGGGRAADLAVFTLTLPDVFTNVLVGGGLGAALIPEFQEALKESPRRARALYLQSTAISLAVFAGIALAVAVAGRRMVKILAPGIELEGFSELRPLIAGSVMVIPLTAATAVSTAYLQSFHRFAVAAMGTLICNVVLVVFLAGVVRPDTLSWLAVGVATAAALRWISQLFAAGREGRTGPEPKSFRWHVDRALMTRYVQALGSSGLLLMVPVVARALASDLGSGTFSAMNYAFRLVELPLGLVITALSVVLLPRFATLSAEGREEELLALARWAIWLTWITSIPLALAGAWFREPIVALVFGHGRMNPETLRSIVEMTAWSMATLPAQGLATLFFSLLSARKDTGSAFWASLAGILMYLPAAWAGRRAMGAPGILMAGVALHWGICIAYAGVLSAKHGMNLFRNGLGRDLLLGAALLGAGFVPGSLLARPALGALGNTALAGLCAAISFAAAILLPRTRGAMKAFS